MKKRIGRIAAALAIGTLAATGITLVDDLLAPQDTAWGAPDTTLTVDSDAAGTASAGVDVNVTITPLDTAWG